jgi:hypothetical protein
MFLKLVHRVIFIAFALLLSNCITQFIPAVNEDKELLVVEGLITDKPDTNTIKLSRSRPLGARAVARPVKGMHRYNFRRSGQYVQSEGNC